MNFSVKSRIEELGYNVSAIEGATVESFKIAVGNLAKSAQNEWIRLAQHRLKTSREDYINGLRMAESFNMKMLGGSTAFEVQLVGRMPNNFEFGMDSFDMKLVRPGWLGGSKAKTAEDGHRYVVIPFRHSIGSAAILAYSGKAKAADLATELKKVAKDYGLNRMVRNATGQVVPGPVRRVPNSAPVHPYLRGLTRIQNPVSGRTPSGKQRGQGTLMTWRVMSENSDASKWQHPGIAGANILKDVDSWVDRELNNVIRIMMGEIS